MRLRFAIAIAIAAVAVALLAGAAFQGTAQAQAAPAVGAVVKDKAGATLGVIVRVVAGPDGRPYQVLVRQGPVARPLLVEALTPKGSEYVSVLSKAEFEILPAAE